MRSALATAIAVAAAVAIVAAAPAGACACGIALEADVVEESAIVIDGGEREEIVAEFDLASDGPGAAAVVIPVPAAPRVAPVRGDPIGYLDAATAPPPEVGGSEDGATASGAGVEVIDRDVIGGYDVTILAAGDPKALDRFLDANGYTLPGDARPILAGYVDDQWSFVAIKLAERSEGRLKPLRIGFSTAPLPDGELVYPMKLSQLATGPIGLTLYVIADGPRSVDGLERIFDAPLSELDPAPPQELEPLLNAAGSPAHVSRLEAAALDPASLSEDLVVEAGAAAAPAGHSFFGGLIYLLNLIF